MRKTYVAYGSNLNVEQMIWRCPGAKLMGKGYVNDYQLLFRGRENNAYATIEPKVGYQVPVGLWSISDRDEKRLDVYEGFPRTYQKEELKVELDRGKTVNGLVYIMDTSFPINYPSQQYLRTIIQGYTDVVLAPSYLFEALDHAYDSVENRELKQDSLRMMR